MRPIHSKNKASIRKITLVFAFVFSFVSYFDTTLRAYAELEKKDEKKDEKKKETLNIESAVKSALSFNERAAAADERVKAAEARVVKAKSVFLPSINTVGTYTRRPEEVTREINDQTVVIQRLNGLGGTVNLSMTLLDLRSFPVYKQLRMENKAEKLNSLETKRALAFEVCNAFLVALGNSQVLKAAEQRLELANKNLEASKARYEAQLISVNDVTRTELEYATAEMNVTGAKGGLETAQLQLEFLVGSKIDSELENPVNLLSEAEIPPPGSDVLIPKAHELRMDIKSLEWHAGDSL